jgi:anti-sigma regulatory factor (Ser/Thr protein kinase)
MKPDTLQPEAPRSGGRDPAVRLSLPARAENVAVVRHVLTALAEAYALPVAVCEDLRLAVTEACTNVVRHAYLDTHGPIDVSVQPLADVLEVVVADRGRGIAPNPRGGGAGLGLPLIAALTDSMEIQHGADAGSRLSMCFRYDRATGDLVEAA